jgi:hypothetical protein
MICGPRFWPVGYAGLEAAAPGAAGNAGGRKSGKRRNQPQRSRRGAGKRGGKINGIMKAQLFASYLLLAATAAANTSVRLASGLLKGEIIQMGREGRSLSLALKITNDSKDADAFILLFGEPSAFDDAGGRWNIVQAVTGVAYCPGPFTSPPTFRLCVGIPRVTETLFPMQGYTDIQPGQSVTVHYQFTGGDEKGEGISLAHDLAYRFATTEKDAAMSDAQKLKALRFGSSFEFKQSEIVTSTIKFGDVK